MDGPAARDSGPAAPAGAPRTIAGLLRSNLVLYGLIGGFSAALDLALYSALVLGAGIDVRAANVVSVLAGIATSFLLNARFNFRVSDRLARRFASFLGVGLAGLALSDLLIRLFMSFGGIGPVAAKLATLVFVFLFQFTLNRSLSFATGRRP